MSSIAAAAESSFSLSYSTLLVQPHLTLLQRIIYIYKQRKLYRNFGALCDGDVIEAKVATAAVAA